ncbi:MAG: universal stress protein [Bacteroidetes bacterium]|nr:universal stress protein [Bacteroidota bacterium]MBU1372663.1 universal stress protein [Bacteroidota bacterium]MBU1484859.1 universal stress protein [Bacteroidota bacterium]MBU1760996.1 universal stress protein [Bacteroidota bacterium]MBU2045589.1 universal stress protein [Bacteroidota bacterium]
MKILLATDGSQHSVAAVEEIAGRPFLPNTELRIISVFENPSIYAYAPLPMGGMENYYQEMELTARKAAREAVETAAELIGSTNKTLSITTAVLEGSAKEVILDEADAFNADLIVVGPHGRSGFERFLLGSVSQAVALHAKCSVEIVRTRDVKKED